jgi:hypothetical protein
MKEAGLGLLRAKPYLEVLGVSASEVGDSVVGDSVVGDSVVEQGTLHYNG